MAFNKVIYGNNTLIDLTSDTVTSETLLSGETAHDKAGNCITGTHPKPVFNVDADGDAFYGFFVDAVGDCEMKWLSMSVDENGNMTVR